MTTGPNSIVFRAANDGHFHVDAVVDGKSIEMLVDTGATTVSLSRRDAARIGIDLTRLVYNRRVMTANGPAMSAPVTLRELRVGPITDPNFPWVLLGRALLHANLVAERNHARRESLALDAHAGAHLADGIDAERRRELDGLFRRLRNEREVDAADRGALTTTMVELLDTPH